MKEFDEEPPCKGCGHICSGSDWNGKCTHCEKRHLNYDDTRRYDEFGRSARYG